MLCQESASRSSSLFPCNDFIIFRSIYIYGNLVLGEVCYREMQPSVLSHYYIQQFPMYRKTCVSCMVSELLKLGITLPLVILFIVDEKLDYPSNVN